MKHFAITLLSLFTFFAHGQEIIPLKEVKHYDSMPTAGKAIIYGNFIQRLGFSSGGFPQEIRLVNLDTKEVISFNVKPIFKSARENMFIFFIEPGEYAILNYWWTQSKWYGGKVFTEPIFKDFDAMDGWEPKTKTRNINPDELEQYKLSISANSLNYTGTWHFDKGLVSFTNEKADLDSSLKSRYTKLDFSKARLMLPN